MASNVEMGSPSLKRDVFLETNSSVDLTQNNNISN
jgi:hypothetical protein